MTDNVTITANGTNNLYGMYGYGSYSTARTTYDGSYYGTTFIVGQNLPSLCAVFRGFPLFNLSSLSGETITAATLKLTGYDDATITHSFYMHIYSYTESSLSANTTCYTAYGSTSFGNIHSDDYSSSNDGMTIELNSSGIDYLNTKVGGNCVLVLMSDRDVSATVPSGEEFLQLYSGEYSTSAARPHLYLEYGTSSTWTPKIMMIMKPLADGFLEWIKKPLQQDMYLQI